MRCKYQPREMRFGAESPHEIIMDIGEDVDLRVPVDVGELLHDVI